jgi:hypothetical protein
MISKRFFHELADRETKMPLAERNQLAQALALDGQQEAFDESVQIGAVRWQSRASDARRGKDVPELLREERVSVVDQEALADQETIDAIGELRATCFIQAP